MTEAATRSDAAIVAGELQDLASVLGEVAQAVNAKDVTVTVNVPELPPAQVTVNVPAQDPPQVIVNVPVAAPPVVNVAGSEVKVSPVFNVPKSVPNSYAVRITERDENGYILAFIITPTSK